MARTKRKPPTAEQKDDARRLKEFWEGAKRASGGKIGQGQFGADHGIGDQGLVTQYLNGIIPLNLKVAIKFARGLGISVGDFSPALEAALADAPGYEKGEPDARRARDDEEADLLEAFRGLAPQYQDALLGDIEKYRAFMKSHKVGGTARGAPGIRTAGKKKPPMKAGSKQEREHVRSKDSAQ